MSHDDWPTSTLAFEREVLDALIELSGKRWLCRGQSRHYESGLIPSIDREGRQNLSRHEKLTLERRSIDSFRNTAKFLSHPGEEGALRDDIIALMVLRHYGVPTRLLDWSMSPYVAAYFAVCNNPSEDDEIWAFDYYLYAEKGKQQWRDNPETTIDGSGSDDKFDAKLTAFTLEEPPDTFNCGFYPRGFPRQDAQNGLYTMTPRFGRDHAEKIADLLAGNLAEPSHYHLYVVPWALKKSLQVLLRESHGIWRGSLYPDSAGAAATAHAVFSPDGR